VPPPSATRPRSTSTSSTDRGIAIEAPRLLEVGRIDRPHGVRGEVVVTLHTPRHDRLAPGTVLATDRGDLTVQASRTHQHRFLVRFDAILDRDAAEAWRGVVLSAEPLDDPDDETLWVHEVVGLAVVDQHGHGHGRVRAVVENPASDLLELEDGRLVPSVFVVDHQPGERLVVEVPDGLLDDRD
tara:strand:- start:2322 stop:2873 length:552 start_codon:yes stop_codon:yes gene_type:complete